MDILKMLNPLKPYKFRWEGVEALKIDKHGDLVPMMLKPVEFTYSTEKQIARDKK